MAFEDLSGGISEHEAGEEFMEKEDERRRDLYAQVGERELRDVLNRRGAPFVCEALADSARGDTDRQDDDYLHVESAVYALMPHNETFNRGIAEAIQVVGKWASEQQKAKGAA